MEKIISVFLLLTGLGIFVWYFYFFEEVITKGEGYYFHIGMKKIDAVNVLKNEYGSKNNILKLVPSLAPHPVDSMKQTNTHDVNENNVERYDVWIIHFNGKNTNALKLFFDDSKLTRISRYRTFFIF